MDRLLRREVSGFARDHASGAIEITLRAIKAVRSWLRRTRAWETSQLATVAAALLRAQPSMAPLLRLANEISLSVDASDPAIHLSRILRAFERRIRASPDQIAHHLKRWLRNKKRPQVFTYSYSSTVVHALGQARRYVDGVSCSESRPGNEGIKTARALAAKGIETFYHTDAGLFSQLWGNEVLLLGADAVLAGWVAAKAGTKVLVARALQLGSPVVFLVDTSKFWREPSARSRRWDWTFGPDEDLWKNPPRRVEIYNLYFELIPISARSRVRFLTEFGWMSARRVRIAINRIHISPRLESFAD